MLFGINPPDEIKPLVTSAQACVTVPTMLTLSIQPETHSVSIVLYIVLGMDNTVVRNIKSACSPSSVPTEIMKLFYPFDY